MTINFTMTPGVGYSGKYTCIAYAIGSGNPSIPVGQTAVSGPFGSSVPVSITTSVSDTQFRVDIYTDNCTQPVGTKTFNATS